MVLMWETHVLLLIVVFFVSFILGFGPILRWRHALMRSLFFALKVDKSFALKIIEDHIACTLILYSNIVMYYNQDYFVLQLLIQFKRSCSGLDFGNFVF